MRIFALVFGVPAALAFMAASMACNANFLTSLSRTAVEFYVLIGISGAVDIFKHANCVSYHNIVEWALDRSKRCLFFCIAEDVGQIRMALSGPRAGLIARRP